MNIKWSADQQGAQGTRAAQVAEQECMALGVDNESRHPSEQQVDVREMREGISELYSESVGAR